MQDNFNTDCPCFLGQMARQTGLPEAELKPDTFLSVVSPAFLWYTVTPMNQVPRGEIVLYKHKAQHTAAHCLVPDFPSEDTNKKVLKCI